MKIYVLVRFLELLMILMLCFRMSRHSLRITTIYQSMQLVSGPCNSAQYHFIFKILQPLINSPKCTNSNRSSRNRSLYGKSAPLWEETPMNTKWYQHASPKNPPKVAWALEQHESLMEPLHSPDVKKRGKLWTLQFTTNYWMTPQQWPSNCE